MVFKILQFRETRLKHLLSCKRLSDYISPVYLSSLGTQIKLLKGNLCLCLFFILIRFSLPSDYKYGYRNHVSSEGYPSMFDFFMIPIMFSFAAAFTAFMIRNKPKLAVLHRCYFVVSMFSMASALSILAYALLYALCLESFRLVTSAIKLLQSEGGISSLSLAI